MPTAGDFTGDVRVRSGQLILDPNQTLPIATPLPRGVLKQEDLTKYPVNLASFYVWDSGQPLPSTAAADDLSISVGTYGTNTPAISAGDVKNTTTTRYARLVLTLPPEYVAGETITLRFSAGMLTTVASSSCTLDVEAYLSNRESLVSGTDICATSAQSINSLTFANKDFTITPSGLNPGDQLDIRITVACTDSATATAVKPTIGSVELLCDVKG